MTTLKIENIILNSASFGETNPMPDLKNVSYIHASFKLSDKITEKECKYFGKGMIPSLIPYLSEDDYNREIKHRPYTAAILENEFMRAIFLPQLGGRLWSLYDKTVERELLYKNEIVQPANLALRNAWVAGGVEWNVGIKGHSPLTCSTLFTAESKNSKGEPILTMYEYERIRETTYGINAMLTDNRLYVRTTIENNSGKPTYTYWWSNIAVPEKNIRVLTDADEMFSCLYEDGSYSLDKVEAPYLEGEDISYPERTRHAGDVFFILNEKKRPWIAAVESDGIGLLQYSTPELIGRKLFFWGDGEGGRNWNRHLTGSDRAYVEIQAGLLRTQMEHLPMESGETISFTECYTSINLGDAPDGEWSRVCKDVSAFVNSAPDPADVDIPLFKSRKTLINGSGWGAVEGDPSNYYEFPESSMGEDERRWSNLLRFGEFSESDPSVPPSSYYVSEKALEALTKYSTRPEGDRWDVYLHLGIIKYCFGEVDSARELWLKSLEKLDTPWAYRNLSMLSLNDLYNESDALCYIRYALSEHAKSCRGLLIDAACVFTKCSAYSEWLTLFNSLSDDLKKNSRLRLYTAMAYVRSGDKASAMSILNDRFTMSDIKEGELSISALWAELYGSDKPLPRHLNFRMNETSIKK